MSRARQLLAAFAVPALVLSLAACGADAADEGSAVDASKLVVYSGRQEQLVGPLIKKFEQQSGSAVSVRYGNSAQLAAQLIEEGSRTKADVFFSQDGGALGALGKRGLLAALPKTMLDRAPVKYRARDGKWVGTSARARVLVYDPGQLAEKDVPDSVFALTDPRWKGKVGIAPSNASFEAFMTAMRVLNGDDAARKWLAGMKANDVQTFDNNDTILNAAEDGLIAIGLINHYYWYEQVAEKGLAKVSARLKFLPGGDPGALVNVAGAAVMSGSDHAAVAQRFVEFLLSTEAQKFFAEETKEYPVVAGVPTAPGLPPLASLQTPEIDLSDLDTIEQTLQMIEQAGLT